MMTSWSFCHTRGTAMKIVGRQACRSSATVARLRANQVSPPAWMTPKWLVARSAMWLNGRYDSSRSVGARSRSESTESSVQVMLPWVMQTPFGGPVVPLVYTSVARSSGESASTRASSRPEASPSARSSSRVISSPARSSPAVPPNDTMRSSPERFGRWSRTLASWSVSSTKQTRASELSRMYATCDDELVGYTGTVTAPADMIARSAMCHSGRFDASTATRSPGSTPSATSPRAACSTADA